MPSPLEHTAESPPGPQISPSRRRRPPGQAEQARSRQWGATWGKVGADYKQQRLAKEA